MSLRTHFRRGVGLKPLHIALAALTTGVICAHMAHPFDTPLTVWFLGALIGLFLYLKAPKYRPAIVACAMIAVGFYAAQSQYRVGRDFVPPLEKRVVQAVISDLIAKGPDFRSFTMRDGVMAGDIPLPGCGRLTVREDDAPLQAGDKITFSARVSKPENRGNPGEFDWEAECRSAGIVWQASIKGPDSTVLTQPGAPWAPERLLFRTRMEISDFLDRRSGRILGALFGESYSVTAARVKGFLKAMLIGDTGGMDVTVKDNFSASGLTHMISPSGLHVALIGGAMIFLVQSALRSYPSALLYAPGRIWGAWVSIPVIIGYCLLVGAKVPAIRSGIMGVTAACALIAGRSLRSFHTWSAAALIILLFQPLSIFTPSFQLSFAAVAGILFVLPGAAWDGELFRHIESGGERWARIRETLRAAVYVSLAATAATTPIALQNFHTFPVYTLFANLAADAPAGVALAAGLLGGCAGVVFPALGELMLVPAELCSVFVLMVASFFSALPCSVINVSHMSVWGFTACTGFCACVLLILRARDVRSPSLKIAAGLSALFLLIGCILPEEKTLRIYFLNVGKADAAYVLGPNGKGILIDGGAADKRFDMGRTIVTPFLGYVGKSTMDAVALSHPEMDHMGGLPSVFRAVKVNRLFMNAHSNSAHFRELLRAAASSNTVISAASRQCPPYVSGETAIEFLNPAVAPELRLPHKQLNDASVVCKVTFGNVSVLFTGDLEEAGDRELLASGLPLQADVLKASHHGGKGTSSHEFLRAVRPKAVVLSAPYPGRNNLPHPSTLQRFSEIGADVYWTGRDGAVLFSSDGKTFRIKGLKHPKAEKQYR